MEAEASSLPGRSTSYATINRDEAPNGNALTPGTAHLRIPMSEYMHIIMAHNGGKGISRTHFTRRSYLEGLKGRVERWAM